MDDARLHDRELPRRGDRLRQPLEAVTHHDAHILDTTVLDLSEHTQPELRALPAITGPDPQDVTLPGSSDPDSDVERLVRDLPITDLHFRIASMNTTG